MKLRERHNLLRSNNKTRFKHRNGKIRCTDTEEKTIQLIQQLNLKQNQRKQLKTLKSSRINQGRNRRKPLKQILSRGHSVLDLLLAVGIEEEGEERLVGIKETFLEVLGLVVVVEAIEVDTEVLPITMGLNLAMEEEKEGELLPSIRNNMDMNSS
jgi:hypothetical protein